MVRHFHNLGGSYLQSKKRCVLSVESDWLFGELSYRVVICSLFPLGESEE